MLNNLVKKLNARGIHAHETAYGAGLYYDGTQHGETIPCILVYNDKDETGLDGSAVLKLLHKNIPEGYTVATVFQPHYDVFRVVSIADKERGEHLQKIADAFLGGFWRAVHENPKARDNNGEIAIQAGHKAIEALTA